MVLSKLCIFVLLNDLYQSGALEPVGRAGRRKTSLADSIFQEPHRVVSSDAQNFPDVLVCRSVVLGIHCEWRKHKKPKFIFINLCHINPTH